jgi:hypothetical protein
LLRHKWRKECGELRVDRAKRLKDPQAENRRLQKVAADLTIDNSISKEAGLPSPIERRRAAVEILPVGTDRPTGDLADADSPKSQTWED